MNLTVETIKAVADCYTLEELQNELKRATAAMIQNPERIVSASTGSGASYTKAENMTAQELVELLGFALQFKKTGSFSTGGNNIFSIYSAI